MSYLIVILMVSAIDFVIINSIEKSSENSIYNSQQLLLGQSRAHFKDQVNTRAWNAAFGGVYVKAQQNLKPNPYLKDNTLKINENQTLIKINPAWMTRQLSELAKIDNYHFRITSLNPLNPSNIANPFEKKALHFMQENNQTEYYQLNDANKKFEYMGALIVQPSCMPCHQEQGYHIGDIRGGISVSINAEHYYDNLSNVMKEKNVLKVLTVIVSLIIALLIIRVLNNAKKLEITVEERTKEINYNKQLLQAVLDAELSFLIVAQDTNPIYINKTLLNFLDYDSFEEFEQNISDLSDLFDSKEDDTYLTKEINGINWIEYLLKYQNINPLKVIFKKGGEHRYFRPHAKEIAIDDKEFYLIIFDEITNDVIERRRLETVATTDTLTSLANRFKFDEVLETNVSLSKLVEAPLSIIFMDLDHFKKVNDTYGHDFGDKVLMTSAKLIKSSLRDNDFVARWGGEEFMVILQSSNKNIALKIAEKIRQKFEAHTFENDVQQTISCGVAELQKDEHKLDFIKRADDALYEAKNSGRNRVCSL